MKPIPIGSIVVPFYGLHLGSYEVTQKGTAMEPMGMPYKPHDNLRKRLKPSRP